MAEEQSIVDIECCRSSGIVMLAVVTNLSSRRLTRQELHKSTKYTRVRYIIKQPLNDLMMARAETC